jgi:CBS domain-containing protein
MSVGRICSRVVASASPKENVMTAARRMADNDVGTLVVVEGGPPSKAIGIVTDRDITVRCVAARLDPVETTIEEIMSSPLHVVDEHAPIEDAVVRMGRAATRRLVVTGKDNTVIGILSMDDILEVVVGETEAIGRLLQQQKPRIPA